MARKHNPTDLSLRRPYVTTEEMTYERMAPGWVFHDDGEGAIFVAEVWPQLMVSFRGNVASLARLGCESLSDNTQPTHSSILKTGPL
jgi:hypothetical protein